MKPKVLYQKGYKSYLAATYKDKVKVYAKRRIRAEYGTLDENGNIEIFRGFPWDGCSGPTIATKTTVRAGLVHDFLYRLIRHGLLEPIWREAADREFKRILLEDGCNRVRAWYFHRSVVAFGASAIDPKNRTKVLTAP